MYWLASRRPRFAQPPPAEPGQLSPRRPARRTERPGATSSTSSTVTNGRTPTSQFDRCVSAVLAACLRAARERVICAAFRLPVCRTGPAPLGGPNRHAVRAADRCTECTRCASIAWTWPAGADARGAPGRAAQRPLVGAIPESRAEEQMRRRWVLVFAAGAAAVWCVGPLAVPGAVGAWAAAAARGAAASLWGRAIEVPGLGALNKGGHA